jgi:outer membrane protein assembly factor BamB
VSHSPSPLLVGEDIFLISDNGIASCRDALSGQLRWRKRLGGNYSASPLYADGRIYFQSEQGTCVVVEASRTFQEVARNVFDEQVLASYAVSGSALFVRTEAHLYRFD